MTPRWFRRWEYRPEIEQGNVVICLLLVVIVLLAIVAVRA